MVDVLIQIKATPEHTSGTDASRPFEALRRRGQGVRRGEGRRGARVQTEACGGGREV